MRSLRRTAVVVASLVALIPSSAASASSAVATTAALNSLLRAATSVSTLPSALAVPLTSLARTAEGTNPACLVDYRATTALGNRPSDAACTTGDLRSKRLVVLFGDSHVTMWEPAISAIGRTEHFRVLTVARAACYVASIALWDYPAHAPGTECTAFRAWAIAHIAALHPSAIVVSDHAAAVNFDPTDQPIPAATYANAQVVTLRALAARGRRVVVIGRTIDLAAPMATCLSLAPTAIARCGAAVTPAVNALTSLERSATRRGGATFVSPLPWLCTATTCPPVVDGYPTYADDNHIDSSYGIAIAQVIATALHLGA